ncbi:MAG: HlyD family type I secretion periplasmic adaptor subunit, partial [Gammaproteobacteria bacterium]
LLAPFAADPAERRAVPLLAPALRVRVEREQAGHAAERAVLEHELARLRAELAADAAEIARNAATLPLLGERAAALATLATRALAPRTGWLELEEARLDRSHQRVVLEARQAARAAALAATQARLGALGARVESDWRAALAEVDGALAQARQRQLASAATLSAHFLRAPVSGVVQQLAVHTVGGVVGAGEELMLVVPQSGGLEIEAWVANKDIGFLHPGQAATIKIETFPFTTYGTLAGTLVALAPDAVGDDERGLVYRARVTLAHTTMALGERRVALAPGMAVTVECALGRRRIIEFLAAPLLRYRAEGLRER